VAWALRLASERSLSPAETKMRLVWVLDARLPPPLVNQPVWDDGGRLLGVADLFDLATGLVGEYDGATHRTAGQHHKDVLREDRFRRAGLEYLTATGLDLRGPESLAERIRSTWKRAREQDRPRRWTTEPPEGWWFTDTAEDRLARRDRLRAAGHAV
jgi:hypothetical protein